MSYTTFLKLLLTIIPIFLAIRKARNDYIVANKRTSAKKKAALGSSFRTAVAGGVGSLFIALCLFASEIFDNRSRERIGVERHQDVRTNQLTAEQVAEVIRKELKSNAQQQERTRSEEFKGKYPEGYVIFSVTETYISEEMRRWKPEFFQADWSTAAVSKLSKDDAVFVLPTMTLNGATFTHSSVRLPRKTGSTISLINPILGIDSTRHLITNLNVVVEVVTNSPMGVTILMGSKVVVSGPNGILE